MSQYETESPQVSGWAAGGITFAATMMVMIGAFQVIAGLAAIFDDDFFVVTPNYVFDLDVIVTGWALYSQKLWAAMAGIVFATLAAIENFFFIPYYPFWSIVVIALCVWVIWSLTRPAAVRA